MCQRFKTPSVFWCPNCAIVAAYSVMSGLTRRQRRSSTWRCLDTDGTEILDFWHSPRCWMCCWIGCRLLPHSRKIPTGAGVCIRYERTPSPYQEGLAKAKALPLLLRRWDVRFAGCPVLFSAGFRQAGAGGGLDGMGAARLTAAVGDLEHWSEFLCSSVPALL